MLMVVNALKLLLTQIEPQYLALRKDNLHMPNDAWVVVLLLFVFCFVFLIFTEFSYSSFLFNSLSHLFIILTTLDVPQMLF